MGRYWNTYANGFEGKFGFGVQSSADPEIFGMSEDTSKIYYVADNDALEQCEKTLTEQYELLKVPKEDRRWEVANEQELGEIHGKYFDYAFEECGMGEGEWGGIEDDGEAHYYRERFEGAALALYRISLGLAIYSELKFEGWCELEAEW